MAPWIVSARSGPRARRPAIGAALALMLSAGTAMAAADAPFPADPADRAQVETWIVQNLDVTGYSATGWSPNALFFASIGQISLDAYPVVRTAVWTEVISPAAARQAGWRSALVQVDFDCKAKRYRELSRTVYALADRKGAGLPGSAVTAWQTPDPDTTMATTQDEVCYRAKSTMDLYAARPPVPGGPR